MQINKPLRAARLALQLAFAATAAVALPAHADLTYTFNFDGVSSGTNANAAIGSAFPAASFAYGQYVPRLDTFGDPIPGTEHWESYLPPDDRVTVVDAASFGRGTTNMLDGTVGSILFQLASPASVSAFSIQLDNSTFGNLGTQYLLFLNALGETIGRQGFQQNVAGTIVTAGGFDGVSAILLPGAKLYDNLSVTVSAVPLPLPLLLFPTGAALLGLVARRRSPLPA